MLFVSHWLPPCVQQADGLTGRITRSKTPTIIQAAVAAAGQSGVAHVGAERSYHGGQRNARASLFDRYRDKPMPCRQVTENSMISIR
jgi:hypothetical protein